MPGPRPDTARTTTTPGAAPPPAPPDSLPPAAPQAAAPSHATTPPAPQLPAQLAPAIVILAAARPGDPHQLTIRLDPAELGQVQLRIANPGAATPPLVEIAVERPETLRLLERDRPRLEQALDRAGIPAEGRIIHLVLAPLTDRPDAPAPSLTATPTPGDPSQASTAAAQQPALGGSGQQQDGQQQDTRQQGRHLLPRGAHPFPDPAAAASDPWSRPARIGVDITA